MKDNKKYYEQEKNECENLIIELMNGIKTFDKSIKILPPKDLIRGFNFEVQHSNNQQKPRLAF